MITVLQTEDRKAVGSARDRGVSRLSSCFLIGVSSLLTLVLVVLFNIAFSECRVENESDMATTFKVVSNIRGSKSVTGLSTSCLDPNGPVPLILMSLGRSGSTSTWQVISKMTGGDEFLMEEFPGAGDHGSLEVLNAHEGDNGQWVVDKLCQKQKENPDAAVVGFKWKPLESTIDHPAFKQGLEAIVKTQNPPIKLVRNRRSPLDVGLSRIKHGHFDLGIAPNLNTDDKKISAHCHNGKKKEKCIEKHIIAETGMIIKTDALLEFIESQTKSEDATDDLLHVLGVPHVSVKFEKLYYDDDAHEWDKIFQFIGEGPTDGLTREQVNGAMEHVATNTQHNVSIANYEEVTSALKGTPYEHLLHG